MLDLVVENEVLQERFVQFWTELLPYGTLRIEKNHIL